jgi:hypothetical protein
VHRAVNNGGVAKANGGPQWVPMAIVAVLSAALAVAVTLLAVKS